jgi:1-aminocyclopropane-1-carboxylate deaminase/D-cysteine desulfhydrase-like pyridoxal-dependent ACC family enzyme
MIELSNANTEPLLLDELTEKCCQTDILRLDKVHPVVSGNKWFKLKYYLKEAAESGKKSLLTFGGAYSNHIIATAFAAGQSGFRSIGIIRGEEPLQLSPTLQSASLYGMKLIFVSREAFKIKDEIEQMRDVVDKWQGAYVIPEGGGGKLGRKGAGEMLALADAPSYTHIMCAIGTGTMFTGIANATTAGQEIIGIPVLKGMNDLAAQYADLLKDSSTKKYSFFENYHFGGYAKKTPELLAFMNQFYHRTNIPTDFVYTGKLLYAFMDLLTKDYFKPGSRILLIHSGGLQGNNSLPEGTLLF